MTKPKTPQIRFHGFTDEWEEKKLGNVCFNISSGKDTASYGIYSLYGSTGVIGTTQTPTYVGNFILIARVGANAGLLTKVNDHFGATDNTLVASLNNSLDINFTYYLLMDFNLNKLVFGSGQPLITSGQLKNICIYFPSYTEQTQIGNYFQKIDDLIVKTRNKLDKLKNMKQACLTKMFPQRGATTPQIRFSGFSDEWEEKVFNELAQIRRGLTYSPSDVVSSGIRVLRSSNIKEDSFIISDEDVFVNKEAINIDYVSNNNILITSANGSSRLVGKHTLISNIEENMAVHGGFMLLATTKQPYFTNALMSTTWYTKFINLHVAGGNGAIGNLNKTDLDEEAVSVPSISEQILIGDFFKNLDNLITLNQKQLGKLQNIKASCLDKMFVNND